MIIIGGKRTIDFNIPWLDEMIEFRWGLFMRLEKVKVEHDCGGINVYYFGPFCFMYHWLPEELKSK